MKRVLGMERPVVPSAVDRFLGSPRAGGSRSRRRLLAGAVSGSIVLHGLSLSGLGLLEDVAGHPEVRAEIPIELVVEAEPAKPAEASPVARPEARPDPMAHSRPSEHLPLAASVEPSPRSEPSTRSGLDRTSLRAEPLPSSSESGNEAAAYDRVVLARLEQHKRFPKAAHARGARGVAVVGFALDAKGEVAASVLLRSAGAADLDAESLAVIRRAAPFPKPPPGARRRFAVDIAFGTGG